MFKKEQFGQYQAIPESRQEEIAKLEQDTEQMYADRHEMFVRWEKARKNLKPVAVKNQETDTEVFHVLRLKDLTEQDEDYWRQFIDEKLLAEKVKNKAKDKKQLKALVERSKQRVINQLKKIAGLRQGVTGTELEPKYPQTVQDFYQFRLAELNTAKKQQNIDQSDIENIEASRELALAENDMDWLDDLADEYKQKVGKISAHLNDSPEAFFHAAYDQIIQMKKMFDRGGNIVETPYVQEMMERIESLLRQHKPVFIHGELGSGKTELAKHVARKNFSADYIERWEKGDQELGLKPHPQPKKPKTVSGKENMQKRKEYEKELAKWESEKQIAIEPYVISGHRQIDPDVFLGGIKIERIKQIPEAEQVKIIQQKQQENREAMKGKLTEEQLKQQDKLVEDAYHRTFNNPVETLGYLGMFYKAMQEGRPIIIDEINAIPHYILIMLNDLLTKEPGDKVKPMVDELPTFTVKSGYCVMATGNWRPDDKNIYVGREKIDAAFLSRFSLVGYDYLPQARDVSVYAEVPENEEDLENIRRIRSENELFRMMLVRLMDNRGGIDLPQGSDEKVFNLAVVARIIQDVFSGLEIDKSKFGSQNIGDVDVDPRELIHENVLSLRQLISLLDRWKDEGYQRPLDDYIFLEYIDRSKARPEEMQYLYQLLQIQGNFFPTDEGWPDATSQEGLEKLRSFNIVNRIYGQEKLPVGKLKRPDALRDPNIAKRKYYSPIEVIEWMFGPAPKRKRIREVIKSNKSEKEADIDPFLAERLKELEENIREQEKDIAKLEGLTPVEMAQMQKEKPADWKDLLSKQG